MNIIKPKKLTKGSSIRIIAPCGEIEKDKITQGKTYLETLGYKVSLGENIFKADRYLAGSDEERIKDLEEAFADKDIDAIICARGGYGAIRIVNKINYEIIKNNPKIFCGYSDISALSAAIFKNTGLITYSGPMLQTDFQPASIEEFTLTNFFNVLSSEDITIKPKEDKIYKSGEAEGILWGGNLATLASLCGTDLLPNNDFILFTEDLNEPAYKIDRYFRQLLNSQAFKENLKGIILGEFLDCDNYEYLDELFYEIAKEMDIPVIGGYKISHAGQKLTIPIGASAKLDEKEIIIKL